MSIEIALETHHLKATANQSKFKTFNALIAELKESFFMAMDALASHKLRSGLTLLGVLVGVFSIIIVMTAMRAMRRQIETGLDVLGGQTFAVRKLPGFLPDGRDDKYWRRKNITLAQGLEVKRRATLARRVDSQVSFPVTEMTSLYAEAPPGLNVSGETPEAIFTQNWTLREGRGLSDSDVEAANDVCVLAHGVAEILFPVGSALKERIKIEGIHYTVVGVLEPKGTMADGGQDNFVVIPITTALNRFARFGESVTLFVQAHDQARYEDTMEQVRGILRVLRKVSPGAEDDFEIMSKDSLLEQLNSLTFTVRLGVGLVSSIALLAAGIGIMNIMLASVTERTREIGIRRAIGAKKRNIMTQFIMEAVVLCEIGGLMGVLLGIIGGNIAAHLLHLPVVIPYDWAIVGLGICSVVGIIFGTYPAYKAANLEPIESLRYE